MNNFILTDLSSIKGKIKNIIFDFGGVIFDIDYQKPILAFKKLGIPEFEKLYHKVAQTNIFNNLETGEISQDEFVAFLLEKINDPIIKGDQVIEAWNAILLDISKERVAIIHNLKEKYNIILLSNTNKIHVDAFEIIVEKSVGLEYFKSAFKNVYYSNEIGMRKPNKNIFLEVCKWNGFIAEETLFIDDSIQHIEGAASCGIYSYHLDVKTEDISNLFEDWVV